MKPKPAKPAQNPMPEEPRNPPAANETALAESKPDNSHILLRIIRMLLGIQGQPGHTLGTFGAIFIVLVWTFATFAVPAILAIAAVFPRGNDDGRLADAIERMPQCVEAAPAVQVPE